VTVPLSAECPGVECPAGCCPYVGWVCCPDNINCASSFDFCPQKVSVLALIQRAFRNIQKLDVKSKAVDCTGGTLCPGGCCQHEGWFCCYDGVFCAISEEYCPAKKAIPSLLNLLKK